MLYWPSPLTVYLHLYHISFSKLLPLLIVLVVNSSFNVDSIYLSQLIWSTSPANPFTHEVYFVTVSSLGFPHDGHDSVGALITNCCFVSVKQ